MIYKWMAGNDANEEGIRMLGRDIESVRARDIQEIIPQGFVAEHDGGIRVTGIKFEERPHRAQNNALDNVDLFTQNLGDLGGGKWLSPNDNSCKDPLDKLLVIQ